MTELAASYGNNILLFINLINLFISERPGSAGGNARRQQPLLSPLEAHITFSHHILYHIERYYAKGAGEHTVHTTDTF